MRDRQVGSQGKCVSGEVINTIKSNLKELHKVETVKISYKKEIRKQLTIMKILKPLSSISKPYRLRSPSASTRKLP